MSRDEFNPKSFDAVLSRVESKLDAALAEQERHRQEIDRLKTWRSYIIGISAGVAGVISYFSGKHQ